MLIMLKRQLYHPYFAIFLQNENLSMFTYKNNRDVFSKTPRLFITSF